MIVFLDLDGTCANATKRFKSAGLEPASRGPVYTAWLKRVQNNELLLKDEAVEGMRELSLAFAYSECTRLVYLTGRSEIYRSSSQQWLDYHGFASVKLVMRPKRNRQRNGDLKERLIKEHLASYHFPVEPVIVIDDDYRGDIEEACHRNKWTFLKACSGGVRVVK